MEGNIVLKQYDGSQILPKDDAILYDMIVGQNGIIKGCELTWLGSNQIHISSGYGIIKGRLFEVADQIIYATLPTTESTYNGILLIVVNLADVDQPITLATRIYSMTVTEDNFTQDEDMNINNGTWEMPIAEYKCTSSGISTFVDTSVKVTAPYTTIRSFGEWEALAEEGYIVDARLAKKQILTAQNKIAYYGTCYASNELEDFPYRISVPCTGVDPNYVPYVTFNAKDAISGVFAPVATAGDNTVYIYANEKITENVTIPVIQCIRKVW